MKLFNVFLIVVSFLLFVSKEGKSQAKECNSTLDNFDDIRNLGTYYKPDTNYTQNSINPSKYCKRYQHSAAAYDMHFFPVNFPFADEFKKGTKVFSLLVFSASPGMPVYINLFNSSMPFPQGYHSGFSGYTTKAMQWEKVTLTYWGAEDWTLPASYVNGMSLGFGTDGYTNAFYSNFTLSYDNLGYEYSNLSITEQPKDQTVSNGLPVEFSIVAEAETYQWQADNGSGFSDIGDGGIYSGSKTTKLKISSTSNIHGYKFRCVLTKDLCTITSAEAILSIDVPVRIPICYVTVDANFTHNQVIWEKIGFDESVVDSFFIYREISTNEYKRVGATDYKSGGSFDDYGADPNVTGYRYRISYKYRKGGESVKSTYHNTFYLTHSGNGNFSWSRYEVENNNTPVKNYILWRQNKSTLKFDTVATTTGNQLGITDKDYSQNPNAAYYVEAVLSYSCNSDINKMVATVNTTRSNIKNPRLVASIPTVNEDDIKFYPNPTGKILNIAFPGKMESVTLKIFNAFGQLVLGPIVMKSSQDGVDTSGLLSGVYFVNLMGADYNIIKKIVVE